MTRLSDRENRLSDPTTQCELERGHVLEVVEREIGFQAFELPRARLHRQHGATGADLMRGIETEQALVGATVEDDHPGLERASQEHELIGLERPEDVEAEAEVAAEIKPEAKPVVPTKDDRPIEPVFAVMGPDVAP